VSFSIVSNFLFFGLPLLPSTFIFTTTFVSSHPITCLNRLSLLFPVYQLYTNVTPHVFVPYPLISCRSTHPSESSCFRNARTTLYCITLYIHFRCLRSNSDIGYARCTRPRMFTPAVLKLCVVAIQDIYQIFHATFL
jgi:hypothetical protein